VNFLSYFNIFGYKSNLLLTANIYSLLYTILRKF